MRFFSYLKLARLHQPIGIWLLFLPCLFGAFLSLKKIPNPDLIEILRIVFLFFIGSILMRSAGCVVNDIFDHKFDKKVARTKSRPISSGEISRSSALIFLGILLICGFLVLIQFNFLTVLSGFFALALLTAYPLTKRITYFPQIFLGLTFNFGILMSSLAILGNITWESLALYFCSMIWTLIYDTIYAFQDIEDDLKIGVKSAAIKFKNNPKTILIALSFLMFFGLALLGWYCEFRSGFFFAILASSLYLDHKIKNCNFKNQKNCLAVFKANAWIGVLILIAIILG